MAQIDLSTLNLSDGTHRITAKARASGYTDSDESNSVSYTRGYTLSGTWVFNENIKTYSQINNVEEAIVYYNFICQGVTYIGFKLYYGKSDGYWSVAYQQEDLLWYRVWKYDEGWFRDKDYRIITFDGEQTVSKDFYEWFTANAVKMNNSPTPVL